MVLLELVTMVRGKKGCSAVKVLVVKHGLTIGRVTSGEIEHLYSSTYIRILKSEYPKLMTQIRVLAE